MVIEYSSSHMAGERMKTVGRLRSLEDSTGHVQTASDVEKGPPSVHRCIRVKELSPRVELYLRHGRNSCLRIVEFSCVDFEFTMDSPFFFYEAREQSRMVRPSWNAQQQVVDWETCIPRLSSLPASCSAL